MPKKINFNFVFLLRIRFNHFVGIKERGVGFYNSFKSALLLSLHEMHYFTLRCSAKYGEKIIRHFHYLTLPTLSRCHKGHHYHQVMGITFEHVASNFNLFVLLAFPTFGLIIHSIA